MNNQGTAVAPATQVIHTPQTGNIFVNAQPWALTLSDNLRATFVFDREGRPVSCFLNGCNYRFGLSGQVLMKVSRPGAPRFRRLLSADEGVQLHTTVREEVARIAAGIAGAASDELQAWLAQILAWDEARVRADRERFLRIYRPVSIVPPDQYRALVLQVTEGCSWNRCSFCSFYRDRRFRIKTAAALREHIRQVRDFLGRGISLRRSIFLGDANALIVPQPRLRELFAVIHEEFPPGEEGPSPDLYAFLDIFGAARKSAEQYAELRDYGLRRVYIGLESGDEAVFRLLNKPGSPQQGVEMVAQLKAVGLQVGIILLAGAGGADLARRHVARSLAALSAMELDAGDLVYISPLLVPDDSDYARRARTLGLAPLSTAELTAQLEELKTGARAATGGRPRVALYHIEEWLY
ncbi:MAG: radical SAM protein [Chloroflexaceae bacterium]